MLANDYFNWIAIQSIQEIERHESDRLISDMSTKIIIAILNRQGNYRQCLLHL